MLFRFCVTYTYMSSVGQTVPYVWDKSSIMAAVYDHSVKSSVTNSVKSRSYSVLVRTVVHTTVVMAHPYRIVINTAAVIKYSCRICGIHNSGYDTSL
jgi:hypothetical protein